MWGPQLMFNTNFTTDISQWTYHERIYGQTIIDCESSSNAEKYQHRIAQKILATTGVVCAP